MARVLLTATEAKAAASASTSSATTTAASSTFTSTDGHAPAASNHQEEEDVSSSLPPHRQSRIQDVVNRLTDAARVHQQSGLSAGPAFVKILLDAVVTMMDGDDDSNGNDDDRDRVVDVPKVANSYYEDRYCRSSIHRQAVETCVAALEAAYNSGTTSSLEDGDAGRSGKEDVVPALLVDGLLNGLAESSSESSAKRTASETTITATRDQKRSITPRKQRRRRILRDASWPLALPPCLQQEEDVAPIVLSVSCGNTSYTWALHENVTKGSHGSIGGNNEGTEDGDGGECSSLWRVKTTWKTAALSLDLCQQRNDDPSTMLEAFLPPPILELFFGPDIFIPPHAVPNDDDDISNEGSSIPDPDHANNVDRLLDDPQFRHTRMTSQRMWQNALTNRQRRSHPVVYVYVISTNPRHELGVEYLLQDAPVILWRLANTDFFTPQKGCYPTLGVDRAATALAAASLTGLPALVVDGGTAMTFTAVDKSGTLVGGGISPGINLKLQSLARQTGALPYLDVESVLERIESCQRTKEPLPFFANNTPDAILSGVLHETAAYTCSVIEAWRSMFAFDDEVHETGGEEGTVAAGRDTAAHDQAGDATDMEVDNEDAHLDEGDAGSSSTSQPQVDNPDKGDSGNSIPSQPQADNPDGDAGKSSANQPRPVSHDDEKGNSSANNETKSVNRKMRFVVTGGDGPLLRALLSPNHSYILESFPSFPRHGYSGSIALTQHDHLVHYGIARVLQRQQRALLNGGSEPESAADSDVAPTALYQALEQTRMQLMGLRMVRSAVPEDVLHSTGSDSSSSSSVLVRGAVVSVARRGSTLDRDLFFVLYDDHTAELVTVVELYDSLMDYYVKGEERLTGLQPRQDASLRGSQLLLDRCPHLAVHLKLLHPSNTLPKRVVGPTRLTMSDLFPESDQEGVNGSVSTAAASASLSAKPVGLARPDKAHPIPTAKFLHMNPLTVVGRRCCKRFEGDPVQPYFGTIVAHRYMSSYQDDADDDIEDDADDDDDDYDLWRVEYDDGDSEYWDEESVQYGLSLYERLRLQDPKLMAEAAMPSPSEPEPEPARGLEAAATISDRTGTESNEPN